MRTIYVDSDFKCHTTQDEGMSAVETAFFDDKCDAFVEGYRFVPSGESWVRSDGVSFQGEMLSPWENFSELDAVQRQYEKQLLAEYESIITDMRTALNTLGVTRNESVD